VLQLHKDEMQARTEPSTTPHFVKGDKVSVVTSNLFLRGQPNKKLRDRQLGPFTVEEQIGKHSYKLKLPAIVSYPSHLAKCKYLTLFVSYKWYLYLSDIQ
jgi:hypothetical protein